MTSEAPVRSAAPSSGAPAEAKRPLVVLFAASPHGGANISSIILGQHSNVFPTGELRDFPFGRQIAENRTCSCQRVSTECDFWRKVVERYAAFAQRPEPQRVAELYRIIGEASGRGIIADVAQDPDRAEQLCRNPQLDVRLVHVRREGQAIVNARLRHRSEGLRYSGLRRLARTVKATRRWKRHVRRLDRLEAELGPKAVSIDYERLCRDPVPILAKLGVFLSLDLGDIAQRIMQGEPLERVPHLLRGGNKFAKLDRIVIRYDDRFRRQMSSLETFAYWSALAVP